MSENIKQKTVLSCWIIFAILIFVHGFEAIVLRMDETVLGENCINMLKGLLILACVAHVLCGYSDCLLSYGKNGRLNLK